MATKKKSGREASRSKARAPLSRLRRQIDRIDDEIFALLSQRYAVVQEVQQAKSRSGTGVFHPERERSQIERLRALNEKAGGPVRAEALEAIFREILSASRALQTDVSVAYLGPPGTFSERAALEQFGSSADLQPVASIADVFSTVERGVSLFGVVPILSLIHI